ncbi:MAG: F0F1 ATP synthase subunit gamma [Microbacterium sp.]|uniref:F0F1 ATP synthase subunit gamma n=1 Tax=Microbacterium sp. TaxID=51671 RepID=UPI0039E681D6
MGAQLRVYKQKIASAQTTKKITKAMELIAASRIQKAMGRVRAAAPFAIAVTRAVQAVATHSNVSHPLTTEPATVRRSAVVIFSSDRGLAGAFNSQIIREGLEVAQMIREEGAEPVFYLVGRKAVGFFQFRHIQAAAQWTGDTDTPHFHTAEDIGDRLIDDFIRGGDAGGVDEIHLVYNRFVSMMTQTPERLRLLPLQIVESHDAAEHHEDDAHHVYPLYDFEPDAATVLDALLPVYVQSRVFNALLQSSAAKHAATQKAMKSASDNADKLITDYTRLRNNARQAEITQQIAEIVGGADALASGK